MKLESKPEEDTEEMNKKIYQELQGYYPAILFEDVDKDYIENEEEKVDISENSRGSGQRLAQNRIW